MSWLVLFTGSMVLLAWPGDDLWHLGSIGICLVNGLLLPGREWKREYTALETVVYGVLIFLLLGLAVASTWWMPRDVQREFGRDLRHPAFVAAVWAMAAWFTYRRVLKLAGQQSASAQNQPA